ncbi:hypothetical protein EAY13_22165 [Escherichia coli]|uniref:hypothetical protein n=1 Tax=Escherichia coli TaxID=562 RepID=UPI00067B9D97|nr:hypothetical protein [Escherichia coli]EEV8641384.1 hypothetical protein [Escherichia coli]EEW3199107.1 hypothetical protein [Escherichia coli]MDI1211590.1 hypothetical protein [Escherichia coli]NGI86648.1 hypothetical protein [Escherichia coli]NGJ00740.1 hypothetical protein [Escherichia coli]
MIWQPEFTDKTLSRKPGAVQIVFVRTGREAGVLIIAELFSEVVTVSQPVPGEEETDITDGIRLSDWYYKYKKSSESNVKDLPE